MPGSVPILATWHPYSPCDLHHFLLLCAYQDNGNSWITPFLRGGRQPSTWPSSGAAYVSCTLVTNLAEVGDWQWSSPSEATAKFISEKMMRTLSVCLSLTCTNLWVRRGWQMAVNHIPRLVGCSSFYQEMSCTWKIQTFLKSCCLLKKLTEETVRTGRGFIE